MSFYHIFSGRTIRARLFFAQKPRTVPKLSRLLRRLYRVRTVRFRPRRLHWPQEAIFVNSNRRIFPCEKAVALSAIYDALDALAFRIDTANSDRGTLTVSSQTFPGLGGRIAVSPLLSEIGTTVEIYPQDGGGPQSEWICAFFDEVQTLLTRSGRREKTG